MGLLKRILLSNKTYQNCIDAVPKMLETEVSDYFSRVLKTSDTTENVSAFIEKVKSRDFSLNGLSQNQIDEYYNAVLKNGTTSDCVTFLRTFKHPKNEVLIDSVLDNGFSFERVTVLEKVLPISPKNMEKRMLFVKKICQDGAYALISTPMVQDELNVFVPALVKSQNPEDCLRTLMFRDDLSQNKTRMLLTEVKKCSDLSLYSNAIKMMEGGRIEMNPAYVQELKDNMDNVVAREKEERAIQELYPDIDIFSTDFSDLFKDVDNIFGEEIYDTLQDENNNSEKSIDNSLQSTDEDNLPDGKPGQGE